MRAALITEYGKPLSVEEVDDPTPSDDGVILRVEATGICMSDWHSWVGHEDLPGLPHVPGHEMAGVIEEVGSDVGRWRPGDRVTVPFSIGCGECESCREGHLNTCDRVFAPGFTHWGSFAELVAIDHADLNLVRIPDDMPSVHAAALGCRLVTSFSAVADKGRIQPGEWLAVHGCGGVGLSAVMIGAALGARVVAVDVNDAALAMAADLGAETTVDGNIDRPPRAVREATDGGAHVSIDAVGTRVTSSNSIRSLRKHGRHVQVGLMLGDEANPSIPMQRVIMNELEIYGCRGIPATEYPRVLDLIGSGAVDPGRLVTNTVGLGEASSVLERMADFQGVGVTVIDAF
ncbi:MAG: zinc-dependent alcohol dehydrogenase family protein [Acidimicrobiia bacterium]|jgi:alcohol dehydrogenase